MKKKLLSLSLLFLTATGSLLAEPPKNPIPDAEMLFESDSYAVSVVQLKPEDEPVKALLKAALESITSGETKLPASMAEVSSFLGRNNRVDLLYAGLPFQGVRVDRMVSKGTSPTYATTLAGWRGLQVSLYNSLAAAPDGKRCRTAVLAETDVINMVARGIPTQDILKGIHLSIAGRLLQLLRSVGAEGTVLLTHAPTFMLLAVLCIFF